MKEKIICTVCARGGSKGVKNKNIRLMAGKPLIAHTIETALASNLFEHVVVSSDSVEIQTASQEVGAEVFFTRSQHLASDTAGKLDVIKDCFLRSEEHYATRFDYIVDLDATSPLRTTADIQNAFMLFQQRKAPNLITAAPARRSPYFNLVEQTPEGKIVLSKSLPNRIVRRQDSPPCFDMNASIYIWTRDALLNGSTVFLEDTALYVMPEERSVDVDSELDFAIVNFLMERRACGVEEA